MELTLIGSAIKQRWQSLWLPPTSHPVLYKIIDLNRLAIRCLKSRSVFHTTLTDIVFDLKMLYGLHPIQACWVGFEYATRSEALPHSRGSVMIETQPLGRFCLMYQERRGNLCYRDTQTDQTFIMSPHEMACSRQIITKFNPEQAFYIGLQAGFKRQSKLNNVIYLDQN